MLDLLQNSNPADLAQQFYQAAPNIDPAPLLAKLDTVQAQLGSAMTQPPGGAPGPTPPIVDANSAASMPGGDYMTKLNAGNAGPGAAGTGGAPWGLISSGVGMLQQAHPQAHLPDFQIQYPGGQPAKNFMTMPGPVATSAQPSLSELFARIRR